MKYDISDINLSSQGKKLIAWAERDMPVLRLIKKRFHEEKPLKGVKLAACLHVTSETANLAITLKEGGASVYLCASNPLSTNDMVASSLVKDFHIPVFAIKGEDNKTYYQHLRAVLDTNPNQTMDDGADLVGMIHSTYKHLLKIVVGSTEETTTGVIRLKAMEKDKALKIPVLAVNDNLTKHLFDNRYGTGQSTIDGVIRATNILLAGRTFVVAGYGWCGRGLAMRARGMGALVIVTEIDPIKALEAKMDGFMVKPMIDAIKEADILVTVTGNKHVVDEHHLKVAKNGIIIANSGHFDVEINKGALKKLSKKSVSVRPYVEEYDLGAKKIYLLAQGRLVNLASAEGHPASVMDMSFAGQAFASEYMWKNKDSLEHKVYKLPDELDQEIARLKLKAEKVEIDSLSAKQKKYLESWREGT
ncbi:adenosylhomocysteinase [Candidatus Roizmanbacteria bacterium RIFOXYB2_FULL_38_10]|uniref:Adenosylhomocysteinase n=1 Tax=Candidatus Roizmanbacteria bacterium RIFOXYD1_FULL_38_12 TaxID=1802093 RepID=A0A1F7L0Q7_9BACT|nr:MAG: adenosylhomocysteinase [Candidatus Roizmanbacteria bacterium RIFOXYA2_FULL_38_14]OGK63724.1 MAG: adenosylhomocysteinase [Candidatus Roizmanbacteria bacterium RIFOXYA1_FULL_37_12]OGK65570.1 MAG: adenosylhomocysteinase [Candidatus Roizmanbacteria bacterium RIFOXYB1_FULL_40_23]OGK68354.1 MAG: adenosylhomocysteinase [Candidatus Roizmanbacteria bacterium RIFOXYB2_FULL_38_10]OGK69975.1 MAG: adenosylhomocysteinase [Candidatus Roizmanbacteria bacterium RIFOXYC1_FULL_38_14]OGK72464.1 MAG: adeno